MKNNFFQPGRVTIGSFSSGFGSTGKGSDNLFNVLNSVTPVYFAISNNGMQSSHIHWISRKDAQAWDQLRFNDKSQCGNYISIKLNVLPSAALVKSVKTIILSAGAVFSVERFFAEIDMLGLSSDQVRIHPCANIITEANVKDEQTNGLSDIASTMTGVSSAMVAKIRRNGSAVLAKDIPELKNFIEDTPMLIQRLLDANNAGILEVPQGVGLSIDAIRDSYIDPDTDKKFVSPFYPYTTSRNIDVCSMVGQAGFSHRYIGNVIYQVRTYPIRVGDKSTEDGTDPSTGIKLGSSGDMYGDSSEISWDEIPNAPEPEKTSHTKRQRRVFDPSFEMINRETALIQPNIITINFVNYLDKNIEGAFGELTMDQIIKLYPKVGEFVGKIAEFSKSGCVVTLRTGKYNHQVITIL